MKREGGGGVGGIESEVLHLFTSISLTQLQTLILHFILYLSLSLSYTIFLTLCLPLSFSLSIYLFLYSSHSILILGNVARPIDVLQFLAPLKRLRLNELKIDLIAFNLTNLVTLLLVYIGIVLRFDFWLSYLEAKWKKLLKYFKYLIEDIGQ